MKKAIEGWNGRISVGGRKINNLRYADDNTLFAARDGELVELIQRDIREVGLLLNKQKTKIKIVDRLNSNHTKVNKIAACDVVSKYVYLGTLISKESGCSDEIRRRIEVSRTSMTNLQKYGKTKGYQIKQNNTL